MTEDIETLNKEIAAKHGITVSRNDPILILHTMNAHLIDNSAKAQQEMLNKFKEEMEEIVLRWEVEAKTKAERILNASLSASKEAMGKTLQESAARTAALTRKEIEAILENLHRSLNESKKISIMNIAAATITFLAAIAALWVAFFIH